jgi:hypothetical protein
VYSVLAALFDDLRALLAGRITSVQILEAYPELAPMADERGDLLPLVETILPALERVVLGGVPDPAHADVLHALIAAGVDRHALAGFPLPEYEPDVRQRLEAVIQAIVDALQAVVPVGVTLAREGLHAGVTEGGRLVSSSTFCQELDADGITAFVWGLASLIQDDIALTTTWPWPSYPDAPTSMAQPDSAVENGVLTIWFGDAREPLIKCAPIRLDGIL